MQTFIKIEKVDSDDMDLYINLISNENLICRNCANATGLVLTCENFSKHKPNTVFYYNHCNEYIKEQLSSSLASLRQP